MRRFLLASATYGLAIVLAGIGVILGPWEKQVFYTYAVIALVINAALFVAFASGLNKNTSAPSLTEVQIFAAIGALLFMVYHAGAARGVVLLWVLVIFVFGVFRLKTPALCRLAAVTWIAHGAILYIDYLYHVHRFDAGLELFQWIMLGGALAWFTFMDGYVSTMRSRLRRNGTFYRAKWEIIHDPTLILDAQSRFEYVNPAANRVFGHSACLFPGTCAMLHRWLDENAAATREAL